MIDIKHWHFESINDFVTFSVNEIETKPSTGKAVKTGQRKSLNDPGYFGSSSFDEIQSLLTKGSTEDLSESMKLLESIVDIDLDTQSSEVKRDVLGNRLAIGDYVTGSPTCFRRRVKSLNDVAPVKIWFDLTTLFNSSTNQLRQKGIAILALVLKLQQTRSVELIGFSAVECKIGRDMIAGVISIRVNTLPLDFATFLPFISDCAVTRRLIYGLFDTIGFTGGLVPSSVRVKNDVLQVENNDVYIPHLAIKDEFNVPIEWVNNQLKAIKERSGE